MSHARNRVRELTGRNRALLRVKFIVDEVNRFLRGRAGYFRFGNSPQRFEKIRSYERGSRDSSRRNIVRT
ncbi:group II intron maturase-specific domain-containing protein [Nocardia sp. NPDC055049]